MGPNNAPVKIYVWSDFQCPNCMRAVEPLKYLSRKYSKDLQVIFKHKPLPSHKHVNFPELISDMIRRLEPHLHLLQQEDKESFGKCTICCFPTFDL